MFNLKVIETEEEGKQVLFDLDQNNELLVGVPVFTDAKAHPAVNTLSVLFVIDMQKTIFVFGFDHSETPQLPLSVLDQYDFCKGTIAVPNKKDWMHVRDIPHNILDIEAAEFIRNGSVTDISTFYPRIMSEMYGRFRQLRNVNKSVPLMKLVEFAENFWEHSAKLLGDSQTWDVLQQSGAHINNVAIPVYQNIEANGLKVDEEKFRKHFGEKASRNIVNGYVYSQYHPYNITGRPSNSFGGVNYAALPKEDGSREAFVSRFVAGSLILADFESFHLRLIADLIGYPQPSIPFHEYLGRMYSGAAHLTQEQYEEGKRTTFTYLYGEHRPTSPIDFFEKVYNWIDTFWADTQFEGSFKTKLGREIQLDWIDNPTKAKVFSYLIQSYESELSVTRLSDLYTFFGLHAFDSKLVLYTYDSVMIDCSPTDDRKLVLKKLNDMSLGGFPIRIYEGKNYNSMVKI